MIQEQWKALEKMYETGKTRSIGVSNFCAPCLKCIFDVATVMPQVNQLQFHVGMPGPDPEGLISYSTSKNVSFSSAFFFFYIQEHISTYAPPLSLQTIQ
jgi:diketogulonate reductase-like aldo/keto reductase